MTFRAFRHFDTTLRETPIRFVDVGARGGWPPGWAAVKEHVQFIGFEPAKDECERLQASARHNERFIPRALHHSPGPVDLFLYRPGTLTSLYPPNLEFSWLWSQVEGLVGKEQIEATTLDVALDEHAIDVVDFIKLDTQGSELDILRGGERTLAGPVVGIELEVEFAPIYAGQPLFHEVHGFLQEHDFELIDFIRTFSRADLEFNLKGAKRSGLRSFLAAWAGKLEAPNGAYRGGKQLIYADALYLRKPEALLAAAERHGANPYVQLTKAIAICSIVAYEDSAQRYIDIGVQRGIFKYDDLAIFNALLANSSGRAERVLADVKRIARRVKHHILHSRE